MGSSRLPGKVLQDLAGKPVLWHVIHRLQRCQEIDEVVVATTTGAADQPLVDYARGQQATVVRGPEDNVLERYLVAAEQSQADIVLRVTGDSPLIDPATIDDLLLRLKKAGADICVARQPDDEVIHEGFSPVTRRALELQAIEGGHDPAVREHVTAKIQEYVTDLKILEIDFKSGHRIQGVRASVDTPADLRFLNAIYQQLGALPGEANVTEVVALLKRQPELLAINAHVQQKAADDNSHNVIVRCDGGTAIGLGHVMRCLGLAETLRDNHSAGIRFAVMGNDVTGWQAAVALIESHHFPVDVMPEHSDEHAWLESLLNRRHTDGIIFDIRTRLSPDAIRKWSQRGILGVCIDDPSDRRLACDLAFYPPVPQVQDMRWPGHKGILLNGWQWVLLGPSFRTLPAKTQNPIPRVLISMGGSDPGNMTLKVLESMASVRHEHEAHVVLGPAYQDRDSATRLARELQLSVHFHHDVHDMSALMSGMDIAIASFGVTAYELAASTVPALLMNLTDDHARSAQAFHDAGIAYSLGLHGDVTADDLARQVSQLLHDTTRQADMREAAHALQIGAGASNMAARIKQALDDKRGRA